MAAGDVYQQRQDPRAGAPYRGGFRANSPLGEAAAVAADGLAGIARDAGRRQRMSNEAWAAKTVAQARAQWSRTLRERADAAEPGAPGLAAGLAKDWQDWQDKALADAPDDETRSWLEARLFDLGTSLEADADDIQSRARIDHDGRQLEAALEAHQTAIITDPRRFADVRAEWLDSVARQGLPTAVRDRLSQEGRARLADTFATGMVQADPLQAETLLANGEIGDLAPHRRLALIEGARSEQRARRQEAERSRRQTEALARLADPRAAEARLRQQLAGEIGTEPERVATLAAGPEFGAGSDLAGYLERTAQVESGGRPDAQNAVTSAAGLFGFTAGTWDAIAGEHPELGLRPEQRTGTDPLSVAAQQAAMAALTTGNADILEKQGLPVTGATLRALHFFGGAVGPGVLEAAAATPGRPIAELVPAEFVAKNPKQLGGGATVGQALAAVTEGFDLAPAGSLTPAQLAAADPVTLDLWLDARHATEARDAELARVYRATYEPPLERGVIPADLPAFLRQHAGTPVAAMAARALDEAREVQAFTRQPLDRQGAYLAELEAGAAAGTYDAAQLAQLDRIRKAADATRAAADADPLAAYAATAQLGMEPVDWLAEPEQLHQALAGRAALAREAGSWTGREVPILAKEETRRLASLWSAATSPDKAGILAAIEQAAGADGLARLAQDIGSDQPILAAAAQAPPATRERILAGAEILKTNPALAPRADTKAWNDVLSPAVGNAFRRTPRSLANARAAAAAIYAERSMAAGDLSGVLDQARAAESIEEATGGILEWNDAQLLAPLPGMSQDQLDDAMEGLSDGDLGRSPPLTADGSAVTADFIRRRGVLTSVGPGQYEVSTTLGVALVDQAGQPYVLDLRAVLERPRRRVEGPAPPTSAPTAVYNPGLGAELAARRTALVERGDGRPFVQVGRPNLRAYDIPLVGPLLEAARSVARGTRPPTSAPPGDETPMIAP